MIPALLEMARQALKQGWIVIPNVQKKNVDKLVDAIVDVVQDVLDGA